MDDRRHAARDALQQRFQALATQFRENHAQWQEAVRVHDRPRQAALIGREGEILTAVQEIIAAYQATIAQRHW
jgi:predicted RNA-binding protein Jag